MREILFRGKQLEMGQFATEKVGGWVYGGYAKDCSGEHIYNTMSAHRMVKVSPSTVGQYTGLTDKNSVKIFEGDVVKLPFRRDFGIVKFEIPEFQYEYDMRGDGDFVDMGEWGNDVEIVGNIHDNPELLEEEL